jgi:hypothetical protein
MIIIACRGTMTTIFSFIAGGLAATHKLCYSTILSSSIVLILPVRTTVLVFLPADCTEALILKFSLKTFTFAIPWYLVLRYVQGFLVLNGSLELMSRQIISGSIRLLFAVGYALFLGFGFTIGAELITSRGGYGADDYTCSLAHGPSGPWYRRTHHHSSDFLIEDE